MTAAVSISGAGQGETHRVDGLAVTIYGPAAGEAVVMSAGLGGHGAYWAPQIGALARSHRVILYDHRGAGESDRALPDAYGAADLAADIVRILDGLSIRSAHVVGHAAGGVAGLELARTQPGRVSSLTVVNGWAKADPYFKRCFEIRLALYEAGGAQAYLKAQPLFLYPAEWISQRLAELDRQTAAQAPTFQSEAALRARIQALCDFDVGNALGRIKTPTLVLSAKDDMLVPAHCSERLAAGLPKGRHVQMPWGGHAVNVTAADAFNTHLLEFLTST